MISLIMALCRSGLLFEAISAAEPPLDKSLVVFHRDKLLPPTASTSTMRVQN